MAVLTPSRDAADVALEEQTRRLVAAGLSEDDVFTSLRRSGVGGSEDALWLYSWAIARLERDGVPPRAELEPLE